MTLTLKNALCWHICRVPKTNAFFGLFCPRGWTHEVDRRAACEPVHRTPAVPQKGA